jgi:hypothetical protein
VDLDEFSVATFNLYNLQDPGKKMNRNQRPWTDKQFIDKATSSRGRRRSEHGVNLG